MNRVFQFLHKNNQQRMVVIVSGLPRSGTSMMMKMLEAGGIPALTDNLRSADDDNPKGYYEFERVKKLPEGDHAWLDEAQGKSVKVISALLEHLPPAYDYKVIFMLREMGEILASQRQMLIRTGKPTDTVSDGKLAEMYRKHLARVEAWLKAQPNISAHLVDYNQMLKDPRPTVQQIEEFLGGQLDSERMMGVVDPSLYRQRRAR
ncbi:MAG TPA: sulfotransferase [Anaerolineales bacterium]|nr:sulfotransferase [Anaerolineales bacterium]